MNIEKKNKQNKNKTSKLREQVNLELRVIRDGSGNVMMIVRSNLKEENKSVQHRVLPTIPYVLRLVESDNQQWSCSFS